MRDFIDSHFDKILLLALLLSDRVLFTFVQKDPLIKLLENADPIVLGALIGLITGRMGVKQ